MGLLKKKSDEAAEIDADTTAAPEAESMTEAASAAAGDLTVASDAPGGAVLAAGIAADAGEAESASLEPDAVPDGAEPSADGSEALLNMFASSQAASDDRELLVELAGEVEVADLVDQARTLAAAMNIALAAD